MQPKTSPYTFRLNNISDEVLINMINSANSKTEFIKNALFVQRKLNEYCQNYSKNKNKPLNFLLKRDDSFKRHPTLQSIVKICKKMKDHH